jgi:hypothetical protein
MSPEIIPLVSRISASDSFAPTWFSDGNTNPDRQFIWFGKIAGATGKMSMFHH